MARNSFVKENKKIHYHEKIKNKKPAGAPHGAQQLVGGGGAQAHPRADVKR
jgi:hypothetical protein